MAGSELARAATCRYDFLDLTQAAVVAEFESDGKAVKALVKAARDGGFDHLAQQLRDDREDARRVQELTDLLTEQGVTVIDRPDYGTGAERLDWLSDTDGNPLDVQQHTACPGHAASITHGWEYDDNNHSRRTAEAVYVCTDPKTNGHRPRHGSSTTTTRTPAAELPEAERAAAKAERRRVITNNKAWASAESVRRAWMRSFLTRKTAPRGTIGFLAAALVHDTYEIRKGGEAGHTLARDLFGCPEPDNAYYGAGVDQLDGLLDGASNGRAQMVALGVVLAGYEDCLHGNSWRNTSQANNRYFTFLAAHGYELSDVERVAGNLTDDGAAE